MFEGLPCLACAEGWTSLKHIAQCDLADHHTEHESRISFKVDSNRYVLLLHMLCHAG